MNTKKLVSRFLLAFVALALLIATADVTGLKQKLTGASSDPVVAQPENQASSGNSTASNNANYANEARYAAIFYHAKHRCDTCVKIEEYAHTALEPAIQNGDLTWEISEYTAPENRDVVRSMDVMTSAVVLIERVNGSIVRFQNLEDVWLHVNKPDKFSEFIQQAWHDFRVAGDRPSADRRESQAPTASIFVSKPSGAGEFLQYGTMHEAIGEGQSEGRVAIVSLTEKPHFFGVGALERLKGEVTVFDSEATISNVGADNQLKAADATAIGVAQATMMAGAYVPEWNQTKVDKSLDHKSLELRLEELAEQSGLNCSRPIVFTIEGSLDEVTFHVINGACPVHAARNKKTLASDQQPVRTTLHNTEARLVGIFAKEAAGKLTHPGTQMHLHIVYEDEHGQRQTGHVENIVVGRQSIIRLPSEDTQI